MFVLKMLSSGKICYPRAGIQAIPDQLARTLPEDSVELNRPVRELRQGTIEFSDGQQAVAEVVLAVPMHQAALITGHPEVDRGSSCTTCVYFAADRPPIKEPILMLNGEGEGPANHAFVLTNATPDIAPPGKALISVSLVGDSPYDKHELRSQLRNWYGDQALDWQELAVYRLPHALPKQSVGWAHYCPPLELEGAMLCGDFCSSPSLQGAMQSGRLAAERIASQRLEAASEKR